jgi:rRNA-processing protein FCF1
MQITLPCLNTVDKQRNQVTTDALQQLSSMMQATVFFIPETVYKEFYRIFASSSGIA